jgi:hypothetical protein
MMRVLNFSFRNDVGAAARNELLRQVQSWDGVKAASALRPDAVSVDAQALAYVILDDAADAASVGSRLRERVEVAKVTTPAPRKAL